MIDSQFTDRFWKKVSVLSDSECWEWLGSKNKKGYGEFWCGDVFCGVHRRSHQISYILTYGDIPTGMCVCHTCDNPSCVNPNHLFLGTPQDNNLDRDSKGRTKHPPILCGTNHPQHGTNHKDNKLSEDDVLRIVSMRGKKSNREIAELFGVSVGLINNIFHGRKWKWLTNL